nr:lipase family protein [Rhodococcus sp. (in: high G+C Gram-positive bacteria)]
MALGALMLVVAGVACSGTGGAEPSVSDEVANASPGELIGAPSPFQGYAALESLTQTSNTIRYRSTSGIDGSPTEVSGVLFVPKGDPPPGGWRVVSIGHSTSGSASRCAPSANIGLLGNLPTVIPFLANGYVVVMTDYQGLGTPGPHPYLEPTSAGYNIIDAVRAAREAVPGTSMDWLGYGVSQGGQAVWSANELSGDYGQGLNLLGSISVSPATDLTPLVDSMQNGTLTDEQITVLPALLDGIRLTHPDVEPEDYLHGVLAERSDVFTACVDEKAGLQAKIAEEVTPENYLPANVGAAERLRAALADYSEPSGPSPRPMLVAYGDQDELILPPWTENAVREGCAMGDTIDLVVAPGQGHGILNVGRAVVDWVDGRLAGIPAPTTCDR